MTPYKGIVRIECDRMGPCPSKRRGNVRAECVQCENAAISILDLDGKILARRSTYEIVGSVIPAPEPESSNL